jgi:Subtilase family
MSKLVTICILLFASTLNAKTIKVAVLDTGYNKGPEQVKFCEHGLRDYTGTGIYDGNKSKHGSNVTGIISNLAQNADHCLIMFKVFNDSTLNVDGYLNALREILNDPSISLLNISMAGPARLQQEEVLLKKLLDSGRQIVVAAGNEGRDLNKNCNVYPACANDRLIVVGNSGSSTTNLGRIIDVFEDGFRIYGGGVRLTGTSQAAAIFTGKILKRVGELQK